MIAITTEEPVQPPIGLSVTQAAGNTMTFRWTVSPGGPVAGHFVFEGGISPGQVLASIPIGVPSLTLNVPDGAFFVRVRSVAGAETSGASNELPIYVNVRCRRPRPPTCGSRRTARRSSCRGGTPSRGPRRPASSST